jgi:hypothetical protein
MITQTRQISCSRVAVVFAETGDREKIDYLFNADVTYNVFCIFKRRPHNWDFVALRAKAAAYTLVKESLDLRKVQSSLREVIRDGDTLQLISIEELAHLNI